MDDTKVGGSVLQTDSVERQPMLADSPVLSRYVNGGFVHVDGWGVDAELIDIFRQIDAFQASQGVAGSLCEIGVHHGRTLILLALMRKPGERVVGIDLFESAQDQNLDASGSGSMQAVRVNLATHAPDIEVDLITANSFDLTPDDREMLRGARMFHIDGGHFMEVVLNDLALAQQMLGAGGVIVIDDYWHSGFPEVHEAVQRYFSTATALKAVPFMTGKNKLFLAHSSHRDRIAAHFRGVLPLDRCKTIRLLGHDAICCDPH